jgi:queuosine precursor transporter
MTPLEIFAYLQQPFIAAPICVAALLVVAALMRRWRTTAALAVTLVALPLVWWSAGLADWAPIAVVLALLAGICAAAIYEGAWAPIYIGLMPVINWSFAAVPTTPIPDWLGGGLFQPLAIVTGLVLVVRDFAQRELKHWIWGAMILGLMLSTLTSWITVVVASGLAFMISETVDWAVYTFSKRPLSERIMISSLASAPLDQIVFIGMASMVVPGIFAWGTILTGIVSKLFGAWVVSRIVAAQERRAPKTT